MRLVLPARAGDLLFSQLVHLHLELANLLIEPPDQLLLLALPPTRRATLKDPCAGVEQLAFLLRVLHQMHPILTGQLIERLLPLDRL